MDYSQFEGHHMATLILETARYKVVVNNETIRLDALVKNYEWMQSRLAALEHKLKMDGAWNTAPHPMGTFTYPRTYPGAGSNAEWKAGL